MSRLGVAAAVLLGVGGVGWIAWWVWDQGARFWALHRSMTWQECVYGDAPCSTAAATWMLSLVGILAFAAAFATVRYAKAMLDIETQPRLGQSSCAHHDEKEHPADREFFILESGEFLKRMPFGVSSANVLDLFTPVPVAFENVGRSPLASVAVVMRVEGKEGAFDERFRCEIGNIKPDGERHVQVYIAKGIGAFTVTWCDATQLSRRIAFSAEDPVVEAFATRLGTLEDALVEQLGLALEPEEDDVDAADPEAAPEETSE